MKQKSFFISILFMLIFSTVLLVCPNADTKAAQSPKGTLRVALPDLSNQVLDPVLGSNHNKLHLRLMYDWLIATDNNGSYNPAKSIAYKWEASSDLKQWTFWIRSGVTPCRSIQRSRVKFGGRSGTGT